MLITVDPCRLDELDVEVLISQTALDRSCLETLGQFTWVGAPQFAYRLVD